MLDQLYLFCFILIVSVILCMCEYDGENHLDPSIFVAVKGQCFVEFVLPLPLMWGSKNQMQITRLTQQAPLLAEISYLAGPIVNSSTRVFYNTKSFQIFLDPFG